MADPGSSRLSSIESDESLISRVRLRDQEALSEIYDRFATIVYSIALRVLGESSAAEEVMQKVFLHVWRNPDAYSDGPLWARMAMVTRNRAIDRLRGHKTEESIDNVTLGSYTISDDLTERESTLQALRRAISLLPSIQRQMLDSVLFDGLTPIEIAGSAAFTGESLASVKAHIRCALLSLRSAIHQ